MINLTVNGLPVSVDLIVIGQEYVNDGQRVTATDENAPEPAPEPADADEGHSE